jgi:hypothetical protein
MLEIKEEIFELKVFGEVISLPYPSGFAVEKLIEKMGEDKGKELKIMREFFASIGMQDEILNRLQIQHYNLILESILPKKN